jgi:glycosyltransferase involved in cell wall biosynthesis
LSSVSIYLFAGDFSDVLQRFEVGAQQIYQMHNEVARLIHDLLAADYRVNIYSFVTPEYREEQPIKGVRVISLGARDHATRSSLARAVGEDDSDTIVAHMANLELLHAVANTGSRAIAVLAHSFNRRGLRHLRSALNMRKQVSLLNSPRFEFVANHCLPATEHLARIGIARNKLIAWDIPHPFDPVSSKPKRLVARKTFEVIYVGSINEYKGVSDLIRAIAILHSQGFDVHCSLVGAGDIKSMKALGMTLGISSVLSFTGLIGNNDVFDKMMAADLVVVPTRTAYTEGFPLTMFEAIASRTPIVCSDHPMLSSVILDGRNASVFPAGNYRVLAAVILRTLTDPDLYLKLSNNASVTWEMLKGPADWRTMIFKWVVEGCFSSWIQDHMLVAGNVECRQPAVTRTEFCSG